MLTTLGNQFRPFLVMRELGGGPPNVPESKGFVRGSSDQGLVIRGDRHVIDIIRVAEDGF